MIKNYQVQAGTVVESFQTLGDWTAAGTAGGSLVIDSGVYQEGTGSMLITTAGGASSNYHGTKTISRSFATDQAMSIDLYVPDITKIAAPTFYLSSTSDFSKYFSFSLPIGPMRNGWNRILMKRATWSNTGSEDWSNTMIRMRCRVDAAANQIGVVYFDNFIAGRYNRPKFVFRFDDNRDTQYTNALPIMRQYGFKGSVFVISSKVGTANYMTAAQLTELHDTYGWDMCDHTDTHTDLSSQSLSVQTGEMNTCKAYLQSLGFTRRNEHLHVVFPFGGYNDDTLSSLTASGALSGGTILSPKTNAYPIDNSQLITIDNIAQTVTLASATGRVDRAIAEGGCTVFLFHIITASAVASTEWPTADFQSLCDYLSKKRNEIDVVTWTEFWQGLVDDRKIA